MTIKIKLSEKLTNDLNTGSIKTVEAIKYVLTTNSTIKTDNTDLFKTALKDLYIIDNNKKYYCFHGVFDTVLNNLQLSF
jgi:hypothetical protein